MKDDIFEMMSKLSAKDAETLVNGIELPEEYHDDESERILSSVMRKAGFEMNETNVKITKKKRRLKKTIICGLAAALVLSAAGWTAKTMGAFDRVNAAFAQDVSPFETEIMKHAQTVENNDLKMSIDGVVADEVKCSVVITLESKSERGEKLLEQLEYADYRFISDDIKLGKRAELMMNLGMSEEKAEEWYLKKREKLPPHLYTLYFENAGKFGAEHDITGDDMGIESTDNIIRVTHDNIPQYSSKHYYQNFTIEMNSIDITKPLILHEYETGLSAELNVNDYIESHRLVSDDPNAFDYVVISPLAVYIRSTQHDIDCGRALSDGGYMGDEEYTQVFINYKDGTSEEVFGSVGYERVFDDENIPDHDDPDTREAYDQYMEEHWDESLTEQTLETYVDHLLDLDTIASVTIDGVTYTIADR